MSSFSDKIRKLANFLKPMIHRKQEDKNQRQYNNLRKQYWQRKQSLQNWKEMKK